MFLKFTDRSMNIYMTRQKRKKTSSTVKFSSQAAQEEEQMSQNDWVHVNDAAKTILVDGEKVSELYLRIYKLHGCYQDHLDQVEDWINSHHPNNDINWSATKRHAEYIAYCLR